MKFTKKYSIRKKVRFNLFLRIFLYFGIVITIFALLVGIIFISLFSKNITAQYEQQLKGQSRQLASDISTYVINNDFSHYNSYVLPWEEMLTIENTDLWIVQNPDNPMDSDFANVLLENVRLEKEMRTVLKAAFHNKVKINTSFDAMYGKQMMHCAAPIYNAGGQVVGAVLLNTFLENQNTVLKTGTFLMLISALTGIFFSFILALLFARQLSRPITSMRTTALTLADGDYSKKTGIHRKDEIGELASTIDILSERLAQNEKEREQLDQMRMDFFANVSHELRTPITVMRGYTETLNDGIVSKPEKIKQYYERMLGECKSMERLVHDLLLLSKMQNPTFEVEKELINLVQVFEDILRSASVMAQKKQIRFNVIQNQSCILVAGDYDRLRQMFLVIIDNAIKFSNENSTIHILLRCAGNIVISIRDEGIGIAEEELPYIFEKFYKSKLRQNATGSGLGLMIAKEIATKHDGSISVKSTLGQGAEFIFTFPNITQEERERLE